MKYLMIAEKPSVAKEFAKALHEDAKNKDGFMESEHCVITWCVGHLVTMSYPDAYDAKWKKWLLEPLPFFPPNDEFKYEIIKNAKKQYEVVKTLLNREDIERIYVCTDSGREGEYIYRLVDQEAKVKIKDKRRVWIDSQTEEEIRRGLKEAKDLSAYDNLAESAYLRAKEDYLMGINFSRLLSVKYGSYLQNALRMNKYSAISVGRVMTCVLGMVVEREREIRDFVKTPFYRILADIEGAIEAEWRAVEGSAYFSSPLLYKENGFKKEDDAKVMIESIKPCDRMTVEKADRTKQKKNAPLLFNLAELQNECSKLFKISPDETLKIAQELYEKKLTTYPRTDARVLSTAVSKEIYKNIKGLTSYTPLSEYANEVLSMETYKTIAKTKYVNDKLITDHYAIIPTGQGLNALNSINPLSAKVYMLVCRRFLSIFYPAAVYEKIALTLKTEEKEGKSERFFASFKTLKEEGYLKVARLKKAQDEKGEKEEKDRDDKEKDDTGESEKDISEDSALNERLRAIKKGSILKVDDIRIKEGETSPPKRYNSGSLILAMENAGQLIEDEELRAQIKGSGIGTSATRAEILKKLISNGYLSLNKKTQIITPACLGEAVYEVVKCSIPSMLNPKLTASWEKGLSMVADGAISGDEYMDKLKGFINKHTESVKHTDQRAYLNKQIPYVMSNYKK